jgi:hypothetical protein
MIRIPFSLDDLDQMAEQFYLKMEAQFDIANKLRIRPTDDFSAFFDAIIPNLGVIIKGRPEQLEIEASRLRPIAERVKAIHHAANHLLTTAEIKTKFNKEVFKIFNYDHDHNGFTKWSHGLLAYDHAELLNLNCCPYCNAQFTYTIRRGGARTRPHFDHFYAKSVHPYLALSFYNLVPSCYVCNSNLKSTEEFLDSTHLHPFIYGFEDLYRFRANVDQADFVVNKNDFDLKLEPCPDGDAVLSAKAERSIKSFALDIRYENHKDIASGLIISSYLYNYTKIKELLLGYKVGRHQLFTSEDEILELLMNNFLDKDQMHKRIFSKLTRDICDEFKIGTVLPKS